MLSVRRRLAGIVTAGLALAVAGCVAPGTLPKKPLNDRPDGPGAAAAMRKVAGDLVRQLDARGQTGPLLVASLASVDDLETATGFGRTLGEQLRTGLARAGVGVVDARLRQTYAITGDGSFALSRDVTRIAKEKKANGIVAGTFAVGQTHIYVNVRVLQADDGYVVAGAQERIARSNDIDKLLGQAAYNPNKPIVPGFERRFNDSMCCTAPADVWKDWRAGQGGR